MRSIQRTTLSVDEASWLEKQTAKILEKSETERKAEADRVWTNAKKNQSTNQLRHVQTRLQNMCNGLERCMYCEDSQGTAIEHFWPRKAKPERTFAWDNLLYACAHCNSNEKRSQFPLTSDGQPLLIDPTAEDPMEHLLLVPRTGTYMARLEVATQQASTKGQTSITTFALNRAILETGRRNTWVSLQALIIQYDADLTSHNNEQAKLVYQAICGYPFASVLAHLLSMAAKGPAATDVTLVRPECLAALERRPEIATWIVR